VSLLGVQLTLLVGPTVPVPAPPDVLESLERVEVSHSDERRSGFQITLRVGRGASDLLDYGVLLGPLFRPCSRVVLIVTFNAVPEVLMDGIITNQQLSPGERPGTSTMTVTGEDVSLMMDMEEKVVEHPAQPEMVIALKLIGSYAQLGLIPSVLPPPSIDVPLPTERVPVQQGTDLEYLQEMAARFGYVFYVSPGPVPLTNTAYWGPPVRVGVPQRALSVNMGPHTNVTGNIDFAYDGLAPAFVSGHVRDRNLAQTVPVQTFASTRIPIAAQPAWATQSCVRSCVFRGSGLNTAQGFARAQGETDASTDRTVTASGELYALRYGAVLKPRGLVGLRGVGYSYDGLYYVKTVDHGIRDGEYRQRFTLTRDGLGAITPVVIP
jgi:hypothetical protein